MQCQTKERLAIKRLNKLLLLTFSILASVFVMPQQASADITGLFPNSSHSSRPSDVYAISSKAGSWGACINDDPGAGPHCATGLNAKTTDFKLFKVQNNNNDTTVWLNRACANPSNVNNKGNQSLRAEIRRTSTDGGAQGFVYSSAVNFGSTAQCQGGDLKITAPNSAFTLSQENRYGSQYRTAILRVIKVENYGPHEGKGQKHFRVNYPAGRVTFDDLGKGLGGKSYGSSYPGFGAFALTDASTGAGDGPEATYTFRFKPDCNHNEEKDVFLKWSDADSWPRGAAQPNNYDPDIRWQLTGIGKNRSKGGSDNSADNLGGQGWDPPRSYSDIKKLAIEKTYTWQWRDVNKTNGVQFWMPFSEGRTIVNCPPDEPIEEPPDAMLNCNRVRIANNTTGSLGNNSGRPYRYKIWLDNQPFGPGQPNGNPGFYSTTHKFSGNFRPSDMPIINNITDGGPYGFSRSGHYFAQIKIYRKINGGAGNNVANWEMVKLFRPDRGPCFTATCQIIDIENNVDGSADGSNAVKANEPFIANVRITNTGVNTLYGLQLKSGSGNHWAGNFPQTIGNLNPGQTFRQLTLAAPSNVSSPQLVMYPGLTWLNRLGGDCGATVKVYQQFRASIGNLTAQLLDTKEDPNRAVFRTPVIKEFGPTVNIFTSRAFTARGSPISATSPDSNPNIRTYGGNYTYTDTHNITGSFSAGDKYCVTSTINRTNGWRGPGGADDVIPNTSPTTKNSCDEVHDRPYISAYGGDVIAGAGGFYDGTCESSGDISTFTNTSGPKGGSGSQLAALSNGDISGFSSASMTAAPLNRKLSFSSTRNTTGGGDNRANLGGQFNQNTCITNYFEATQYPEGEIKKKLPSYSWAGAEDGKQTLVEGNVSLSGSLGYSKRHTLYVDGDVLINNNIQYSAWSNISDIPNFTLVVRGNIYIKRNVTQLNGTYIAQPTSPGDTGSGKIYTCVQDNGDPFDSAQNLDTFCDNQLTVVGALIAEQMRFLRTHKTLRDSVARDAYPGVGFIERIVRAPAAEKIIFTPELYLSPPVFKTPGSPSDDNRASGVYEYITTLPPIL